MPAHSAASFLQFLAAVITVGLAIVCGERDAAGAELAETAKQVFQRTNEFRAMEGLGALAVSVELAAAADAFARAMARSGNLSHSADGRQPIERAAAQGYDHCIVSENIAYAYRSTGYDASTLAQEMIEGWKKSPGHRNNMLDPAVTQTGVSIAQDDKGRYFGVQMFGRPKAAAIRFSLRNRSPRKIEYLAGEGRFSLAPRSERTHTVCRPLEIAIERLKPFSATDATTYVIVERAGELAVQLTPRAP